MDPGSSALVVVYKGQSYVARPRIGHRYTVLKALSATFSPSRTRK